ncbi:MAG: CHAT domain-containing protein [Phormidesmis sp.]
MRSFNRFKAFKTFLFTSALGIALSLGQLSPHFLGATAVIAQSSTPAQLVKMGVEAHQQGDYRGAITIWEQALAMYPPEALTERAIINENLARTTQQVGETAIALDYWKTAASAYQAANNTRQFGRMLTEQAQVYISRGQHQRAAALLCGTVPNVEYVQVGNIQVKQRYGQQREEVDAEILDAAAGIDDLGQAKLCSGGAYAIANETSDVQGQAAALGSLAETNRLRGRYEKAQALLKIGLAFAHTHNLSQYEAPMLNSLGNLYIRQSQVARRRAESVELVGINVEIANGLHDEARDYSQDALATLKQSIKAAVSTDDAGAELSAQVNLLLLQQQLSEESPIFLTFIPSTQERLRQLIEQLPPNRETVYAAISLAKSYQTTIGDFSCQSSSQRLLNQDSTQQSWLETAHRLAQHIQDSRAESFVLGSLGHLAECQGRLEEAIYFTQQAQLAAGHGLTESADSAYLWEWQMGRLYWKKDDLELAAAAYEQAIATLETIRTDILTADRELQFDFRDTVEPIYRQSIELQLAMLPKSATNTMLNSVIELPAAQAKRTLQTIDNLRLAELQNFFGDDCIVTSTANTSDQLLKNNSQTAVISSIVLSHQVVLMVTIPNESTKVIRLGNIESLKQDAEIFQAKLKRFTDLDYDFSVSQRLYQRLFRDLQPVLEDADIHTLVFIQDGFLRNIPMAALHDGQHYLIENYAIAATPALGLTAVPAIRKPVLKALAVGLSEATTTESGQRFAKLDSVPDELESVAEQLPNSTILLNRDFTKLTLTSALENSAYSVLHLATHGQFSTIPEETFVVTGTADTGLADIGTADTLTFGELEALIRVASPNADPVDLITLTACETATGDDRATLGLAGVAIRAGARSVIASLWKVDDDTAADVIKQFYGYLKQPELSKAQALQHAQIDAIHKSSRANPGRWAPLLLVGSWQ